MPRQRWYAAKARLPSLRLVAWWDLPADDCTVRTFLVADEGALPVVLYQVPVVARATSSVEANPDHVIGSPEPGTTFIDGPFDPAYSAALLRLIGEGARAAGPRTTVVGHPSHDLDVDLPRTATVLAGEQSNTSLIYRADDDTTPIICKVFRQLHPGLNPDIELTTALAAAGSPHVPPAIGSVDGEWPDDATAGGSVSEHLHERTRCKTIFATHYHELVQLADELPHLRNFNVAVREVGDQVLFLHRLQPGGADRSYGVEVGRLAGLPPASRLPVRANNLVGMHS